MFYACDLHVLCIVPMLIIHPHILKHYVGGGNHCCLRWNVRIYMQRGTRNLSAHLDHWFYASNQPSRAMIQISNFREDKIVSMFYACGLYVLCIVPMLIIHPYSWKHDVVEAITVGSGGMSISWRLFFAVTRSILFFQLLISMQRRGQKLLCAFWPLFRCIQSAIICHEISNFEEDKIVSMFYAVFAW